MDQNEITVDYLIVGAGAMGMAFADVLAAESDATIAIVDRHAAPGGHWTLAYPFVRLHGPSMGYGVNSRVMASDVADSPVMASGQEVLDYFDRVMLDHLLPSGRVTYLARHNVEDFGTAAPSTYEARSLITGASTHVHVRKRIVDGTYMDIKVPAMRERGYSVADDARVVPIGELASLASPSRHFTVVGSGKTGVDACLWLLDRGIDPDVIRWISPRDAWMVNRAYPAGRIGDVNWLSENLLGCHTADDIALALERAEAIMRLDTDIMPSAFRCATVSTDELTQLRRIIDVVRLGRIRSIDADRIELADGTVPIRQDEVVIDCSADGLTQRQPKPLFSEGSITLQLLLPCVPSPSATLAARIECLDLDDDQRNRLAPPVQNPVDADHLVRYLRDRMLALIRVGQSPDLDTWFGDSRLRQALTSGQPISDPEFRRKAQAVADHMCGLIGAPAKLAATP